MWVQNNKAFVDLELTKIEFLQNVRLYKPQSICTVDRSESRRFSCVATSSTMPELIWNLLKQEDSFTLYVMTLTEMEWTISRLTK
jgi:hypothetical protein